MNILLLSDLHLEKKSIDLNLEYFTEICNPDIICLCGDIGDPLNQNYQHFLLDCANKCIIKTFVIMGNHEAYGKTLSETSNMISKICKKHDKLVFLNNSAFDVGNIRFLGSTLWSDIDISESWNIRCDISDFHNILNWGIGQCKQTFSSNITWIQNELNVARNNNIHVVVLTHHVPLLSLGDPKYKGSPLKSAFASDLKKLFSSNSDIIKLWCYGHDHYSMDIVLEGTRIVSNQYGYNQEQTRFNKSKVISLPA